MAKSQVFALIIKDNSTRHQLSNAKTIRKHKPETQEKGI